MRPFTTGCIWVSAAVLSVLLTVSAFLPAAWLAPLVERSTGGRITLGDAQGSLWNGSAFLGAAPSGKDAVMSLLPGRFSWHLSPLILLGRTKATIENTQVLAQPVSVLGNWYSWTISPGSLLLPAERLVALGAPLNTLQPTGKLLLSWVLMRLERRTDGTTGINCFGAMTLDMRGIETRLTPLNPLGSYRMQLDWRGERAGLTLQTLSGSLVLNGGGTVGQGHFQFSGTAEAAAGQEDRLAGLLSLLGQSRRVNGKNVIGLEFTS
ncbi:type II secretion system protein N [Glaciimonas immobilis]|uniref:Type II secretion system protein N n=1 Tax=Glaciimonas immobilis TaxID=728004 RepID=A0A840RTN9_9BURK|nr:type II secretion system protein N [Glaciimonas immobilis]KAF3996611.1 type II secretion system protein N [Glaciimonas immobilis]MBB5201013.1 general secretion pathway protein N [Glaciimonas immobilis]